VGPLVCTRVGSGTSASEVGEATAFAEVVAAGAGGAARRSGERDEPCHKRRRHEDVRATCTAESERCEGDGGGVRSAAAAAGAAAGTDSAGEAAVVVVCTGPGAGAEVVAGFPGATSMLPRPPPRSPLAEKPLKLVESSVDGYRNPPPTGPPARAGLSNAAGRGGCWVGAPPPSAASARVTAGGDPGADDEAPLRTDRASESLKQPPALVAAIAWASATAAADRAGGDRPLGATPSAPTSSSLPAMVVVVTMPTARAVAARAIAAAAVVRPARILVASTAAAAPEGGAAGGNRGADIEAAGGPAVLGRPAGDLERDRERPIVAARRTTDAHADAVTGRVGDGRRCIDVGSFDPGAVAVA